MSPAPVCAQTPAPAPQAHEIDTQWPGIYFEVLEIRHILQNRLLVILQIKAKKETPPGGVFLGTVGMAPPNTKPENLSLFNSKPFTLAGATMTDERTGQSYAALPPIAPPNMAYFPEATLTTFSSGQRQILSVQFDTPPPPPPPPPGQKPIPQTLSFVFPKSKGPITHVPMPPLAKDMKTP